MSALAPDGAPKTITILGGSGLLGSAVATALAARPIRLRLVSRTACSVPSDARAEIEVVTTDLTDPGALEESVHDAHAVLSFVKHTGGWRDADSVEASRVNVTLMQELVNAVRRRGATPGPVVVYAGSSSQAGVPARVPLDGSEADRPATAFDRQKLEAEQVLLAAAREGVLRGVSLRLPMVFGGTADRGVVTAMARRALEGRELTVWDQGTVKRDLVATGDAAAAFAGALDHADALTGRPWLVGTGRGVSLIELFRGIAATVAEFTGAAPVPVVSVPAPPGATAGDLSDLVLDSRPFRSVTGWRPRTALSDGLRAAVKRVVGEVRTA